MATFSWGDTARAAFATCLTCFPQYRQNAEDEDDNNNSNSSNNNNNNQRNSSRDRDELESLLRNAEHSDGEMDTDAVSLHSNVGDPGRKRQKQRRRRRKHHNGKGTIRLFGYDLFGKPVVDQAEGYSDGDDDADSEQRRISRLSSSTLDSDPMPVEEDTIARLSAGRTRRPSQSQSQTQSQSQVEAAPQSSQSQDEEAAARKAARKEKRRQRKLSSALLNAEQSVEFEGFQGSGGDGLSVVTGALSPSSPSSSGLPLQHEEEFGAFQEAHQPYSKNDNLNVTLNSPSRATAIGEGFVRVPRTNNDVEDDADNNDADFDAVAYIRRNSVASRSDSGSGSRSHTSVSMSRSEGVESARARELQFQSQSQSQLHGLRSPSLLHDPRQHPLSPSELVLPGSDKPSKRTRRSTTSGLNGGSDQPLSPTSSSSRKPRRSRRSTTAGSTSGTSSSPTTTTTTMSFSPQPRSPDSLPTSDFRIVQPSDNYTHNHNHNHLRIPQHNPAFEGVPEDDGEFTGSSPLPSPFRSPASDLPKVLPSPGLSTATLDSKGSNTGFPSVGFGGRRNSSATASMSGAFLARTGDD